MSDHEPCVCGYYKRDRHHSVVGGGQCLHYKIFNLQRELDEALKINRNLRAITSEQIEAEFEAKDEVGRLRTAMRKSMDAMGTSTLSYAILRDALEESDGD